MNSERMLRESLPVHKGTHVDHNVRARPVFMEHTTSSKKFFEGRPLQSDGLQPPAKICLNGRQLRDLRAVEEVAAKHRLKVEFLQMRSNILTSVVGIESFGQLRTLDLSCNDISTPEFYSLGQLKRLKRLYLNSNGISSLQGFPLFEELESLSFGCNILVNMRGMLPQPNLKILSVRSNYLSSLAGLPRMHKLEVLQLQGNPVSAEGAHRVAIATVFGPQSTLEVDGQVLSDSERQFGSMLPWCGAMAVQDGWMPRAGDLKASHQECLGYFTQRQIRAVPDDSMIRLLNIETFGTPKVGNAISVNFQFAVTKGVQDMHTLSALSTSLLRSSASGSSSSVAGSAPTLLQLHHGWSLLGRKLELEIVPDCSGNTFVPLPEHVGCLVRVDCTASAFVHGKLYNLSAFALFPPISNGVPVVAAISWTGQFKVGCTVSADITMHDASHARSKVRMGWTYPGDSSTVSWIDAPAPLDSVPVITITRRDVGSVLVCEVVPVSSAGQEGLSMVAESQPVQADNTASSPVISSQQPSITSTAFHSFEEGSQSTRRLARDDRPSTLQPHQQSSTPQVRGLQSHEVQIPQPRAPQHTQSSDDRPSMIQSVSVMGDGVVGSLMRSHVSFPAHEMKTASAIYVKHQWFRSYATSAPVARVPTAASVVPTATASAFHVTQKLMSDGSHHSGMDNVSGASGDISGDDDDADDEIISMPLPENSPAPAPAILSPTSPMEPRQAVFPSALALSLSPVDPSASPAPGSQWLDISGATQPVYTTTVLDVGCVIGVRVWLDWAPSQTSTAMSDRRVYLPPTVMLLDVQGAARTGQRLSLTAKVNWYDNVPGECKICWIRQHPLHMESMVVAANCSSYQITQDDVDHLIIAEYTPVSAAGLSGDKATASTAIIQSTGRIIMSCSTSSDYPKVGRHIEVDFAVVSGANSTVQWYVIPAALMPPSLSSSSASGPEVAQAVRMSGRLVAESATYNVQVDDIDCYLVALIMASLSGASEVHAICPSRPVSCVPYATDLSVSAELTQPPRLIACATYNHLCGISEGQSKWQWHVITPQGVTRALPGATSQSYTPLPEHSLHRFFFRYKPVSCADAGDEGADEYESPMSLPWRQQQRIISDVNIAGLPATEAELLKAQVILSPDAAARSKDVKFSYQWMCDGLAITGAVDAEFRPTGQPLGALLSVNVCAALDSGIQLDIVAKTNALLPAKPVCKKLTLQCGPQHSVPIVAVPVYSGGVEGNSVFRWFRVPSDSLSSPAAASPVTIPLICTTARYQPTCDDISSIIGCEYTPVRVDGVKGDPVQALCPEAVICDPRVVNRVQTHLSEGTAGFHLNIFDSSGNLFPRKLAITPLQITVLSPPTAGQPGTSTSYPLTQQTSIVLVPGDNQRSALTVKPGTVLSLSSENHLKRDVLVMVLRQWISSVKIPSSPPPVPFFQDSAPVSSSNAAPKPNLSAMSSQASAHLSSANKMQASLQQQQLSSSSSSSATAAAAALQPPSAAGGGSAASAPEKEKRRGSFFSGLFGSGK